MSGYAVSDRDNDNKENQKLSSAGFDGPVKSRHCTDCLMLLALIAAWVAMSAVGLIVTGAVDSESLPQGNPMRLTNGIDYNGKICGLDSPVQDKSKAYYLPSGIAVCVSECPDTYTYTEFICMYDLQSAVDADSSYALGWAYVAAQTCMYKVTTEDVLNNCVYTPPSSTPSAGSTPANVIATSYEMPDTSVLSDFMKDVQNNLGAVFGFGLGVSVFVGFVFLAMLRIPGLLFIIIWTIMLSIFGLLAGGGALFYQNYTKWNEEDPQTHTDMQITSLQYLSYILWALAALYLCLMMVLRKRINLAVSVVKEAARAVSAMPMIMSLPLVQSVGVAAFMVPWVIFCIFLASAGEVEAITVNGISVKQFVYTDNLRYAMLYMVFVFFWTTQFIVAIGQIITALSISGWYFTREKSQAGNSTYWGSFSTALRYHAGTAAFGSLIIAIVLTIRTVVAYLQYKFKDSKNPVIVFGLRCLQCCLWCLEKILRFIQKHAYIQTAIHGYSFCKAARCGFFLIARNILRVTAVKMVEEFVLLLGHLVIPAGTTVLAYIYFYYSEVEVEGVFLLLIFICVMAYFIASVFLEVVGMAIETILQCFIADEEMGGAPFATPELLSCMAGARQHAEYKVGPEPVSEGKAIAPVAAAEEPMP